MRYGKLILLTGIISALAACAPDRPTPTAVSNRVEVPQIPNGPTASSVSPVEVPPGLTSDSMSNEYAVPDTTQNDSRAATLLPPGSGLEQPANTVQASPMVSAQQQRPAKAPAPVPQATAAQTAVANQHTLGNVGLSIKNNYTQAWKQVGRASSSAGYPVMEEDSTTGTYYILDKAGSGGVIKRDTPIYQLKVQKKGDNNTMITVYNAQNQPADPATTQRILSAVKNKLD